MIVDNKFLKLLFPKIISCSFVEGEESGNSRHSDAIRNVSVVISPKTVQAVVLGHIRTR